MTEEYISKKEIDKDFDLFIDTVPQNQKAFVYVFKSRLDMILTADVEPVTHGHWKEIYFLLPRSNGCRHGFQCSVCKKPWYCPTNYCPNCGAKMDEKENKNANL